MIQSHKQKYQIHKYQHLLDDPLSYLVIIFVACFSHCKSAVEYERVYFENGKLKYEVEVVDGKYNGKMVEYYPTGELFAIINYKNNLQNGEGINYFKNGIPKKIAIFDKGKKTRLAFYREDGSLQEVHYFNEKEQLIDYTKYIDSAKVNFDERTKRQIIISDSDTIRKGEIYEAQIRLGNRYFNNVNVYLGDFYDSLILFNTSLPRIDSYTSILRIDTDTCDLGELNITGALLEFNDEEDDLTMVPLEHKIFILE